MCLIKVDFPIGYAELAENKESTVFYVEWLDSNSEFPDLSLKQTTAMDAMTWDFVESDKELTLVPEENNWSKINAFETHTYVQVAEKNADTLKPTQRTLQPLWPNLFKNVQEPIDDDDDDLTIRLYETYKSQSKLANRSSHLKKKRLDLYSPMEGTVPHHRAEGLKKCTDADLNKYKYSHTHGTKNHKKDFSEYSVLDSAKKRF